MNSSSPLFKTLVECSVVEPDGLNGELVTPVDILIGAPVSCSGLDPSSDLAFTSDLIRFSGDSVIDIGVFKSLTSMEQGITEQPPFKERSILFDSGNKLVVVFSSSAASLPSSFVAFSQE